MGKTSRRVLLGIATLLIVLTVALALVVIVTDWRRQAEQLASQMLDRKVTIERLGLDPGAISRLRLGGLVVANDARAGGRERGNLISLDELEVAVRPLSILWGPVVLPEIAAKGVRLDLARDQSGRGNWLLGKALDTAGEAVTPDTRRELPTLGTIALTDARITFSDAPSGIELQARVDDLTGTASRDDVALELTGSAAGRDLQLRFDGGALQTLRSSDQPYPVKLELSYGASAVSVQGALSDPMAFKAADLQLTAQGPSLAQLYPLVPTALPATPPYQVSGTVALKSKRWTVTDLQGRVGDTDLAGSISFQPGSERPAITAKLRSDKLVADDLYAMVGGKEPRAKGERSTTGAERREGLFPDVPLKAKRLRALDFAVSYVAQSVVFQPMPLHSFDIDATLRDSRLLAKINSLGLANGEVFGEMALNARQEIPSADIDVSLEGIELAPFFRGTSFFDEMKGRAGGQVYLLGTGWSLDDLLGSARGHGRLHLEDATVSGLLLEAVGLDVLEALGVALSGNDPRVAVRCGVLDFNADNGLVKIYRGLIDTTDSVLVAGGQVDLGAESLTMSVRANAKDLSLFDVNAPVRVSGALTKPEVSIGAMEGFPVDLGNQEDLDCSRLLKEAPAGKAAASRPAHPRS